MGWDGCSSPSTKVLHGSTSFSSKPSDMELFTRWNSITENDSKWQAEGRFRFTIIKMRTQLVASASRQLVVSIKRVNSVHKFFGL